MLAGDSWSGKMKQGLFRKEALEARRTNWLGGMLLSHPVPTWVLTAGALVATSCIVLFLVGAARSTTKHRLETALRRIRKAIRRDIALGTRKQASP